MIKFDFKGTPGPWHAVEYSGTINIQDGQFYGDDNLLDMDNFECEEVEANAAAIAAVPNMLEFIADVADALGDKSALSLWEMSVKQAAEEILNRIANQNT